MFSSRTSWCAAAAASALAVTGVAAAPLAGAATSSGRHTITHTSPLWTSTAKDNGAAAANGTSHFRVYLAPHGGIAALKADVAKVSDPASASYGHYLSATQFHSQFDATTADVNAVSNWLSSNGLKVQGVESQHRFLTVQGTNASVQKAFAVKVHSYQHKGRTVQAPTANVSVPTSLAGKILTVSGLDTTPRLIKHVGPSTPAPAGFRNARPCSAYYGEQSATTLPQFDGATLPYAVCGYTGPQFRSAYEGATALTGKDVTVAITDAYASPTIASDASTYAGRHGDSAYKPGQLTQTTPNAYSKQRDCGPNGWWGEETLDVEAVHAMAPAANIAYYASASCYDSDFLNTLARVVDDNKASLVSNSWSDLEANESPDNTAAYQQIFLQGAMQGIGFMFSSGDNGDEVASSGVKQVDYPSSDPYVTAVGGTADAIGATGSMMSQTGWGTEKYSLSADGTSWDSVGYLYGAGGGNSTLFAQPAYQAGVVPASQGSGRAVPDIAMDADPTTGMLVGQTQKFSKGGNVYDEYRIGGTSLASPLMAGMAALRTEKTGARLGFLNPLIYGGAGGATYNDVQGAPADAGNIRVDYANGEDSTGGLRYSVRTFNQDSSLATASGWDDVTGVGSPTPSWLN